ncbi:MAG TPA: RnfH family protein [Gammaproteobacteria bacterium]|nr:RnfH family protein [Gammaproteobacteria bacterium]
MDNRKLISVEVAYARSDRQLIVEEKVPEGSTVREAIELSGILEKFPEIDLAVNKVGIYGKLVKLDSVPRERDRIEIYRPLIADPKTSRKKRAAKKEKKAAPPA